MVKKDLDIKLNKFLEEDQVFREDLSRVDVEKNWERFLLSTLHGPSPGQTPSLTKRNRFLIRMAAAILLLLLAVSTFYFTDKRPAIQIIQASTDSQKMELRLSDGSAITLNKATKLSYPEKLKRGKREVYLEGEAFFQVEHAENSPFYIHMTDWTVKVLGTSFNLKMDPRGQIQVSVVKGTVLFYEEGKLDQAIRVTAGERCICNMLTGESQSEPILSENYLYWKTQKLIYRDAPLSQVIGELASQFEQTIIVTDPLVSQNKWTSTHEDQDLSEVLEELCVYFDLEQFSANDTIFLLRK
jgi:ferric-dicitrate binding protein FerR (iron transport regulator)